MSEQFRRTYPGGVTSDGGDIGSKGPLSPTPPRQFGQLPDLAVPDDFDEPLPPSEAAVWEAPDSAAQHADTALDDAWLAWPIDEADLLDDALGKSEADNGAANSTFSKEEAGLPRSDTGGHSSP